MYSPFGFEMLHILPTVQGMEWIILVVVVVILLFGAKKLPELARSIGRATGEFQRGKAEMEREIKEMQTTITAPPPPIPPTTSSPPPSATTNETSEQTRLIKVAKELGIETEGKTENELREEIAKAMMR